MTHDNKKETERAELHRTIWKIAEELRGSVDGWDFKNYVLGILFIASFQKTSPNTLTIFNTKLARQILIM